MQQRHDLDFVSVARILNLPASVAAGQPVIHEQLLSAIEGLDWKDAVRGAAQGNVNLASPGATIDAIAPISGVDRWLLYNQTAIDENGIYIWNGAASAMTRALDASTGPELEGAVVSVKEGTDAGVTFRQTQVDITLETDDVIWETFGTSVPAATETTAGKAELATQAETDAGTDDARIITPLKLTNWSGRSRRFEVNIGDNTATQIDVTHNLNSRDVEVQVYRNSTPWDNIGCDISRPDANTVRLNFATGLAPTTNQFRVLVKL